MKPKTLMQYAKRDWNRLATEKKIPKDIRDKVSARFSKEINNKTDVVKSKIK